MKTLCSLLLGCALLAPARAARADSYTIPLKAGFNLIANQLDYGNNTLDDVLQGYYLVNSTIYFLPTGRLTNAHGPCSVQCVFTNGWFVPANNSELATLDEFDLYWTSYFGLPWQPRVGLLLNYYRNRAYDYHTFEGTPRVGPFPSLDLPAGGFCLLARADVGIGTYENIVGKPPGEGHQVIRLRRGSLPSNYGAPEWNYGPPFHFAASNLFIHTFTNGAWDPAPPQLDIGEAAWFGTPPALLNLAMSGTNAVLSWPAASIDYTLECSPQFGGSDLWSAVNTPRATNGPNCVVTVPVADAASRFYRLKKGF